MNVSTLAQQCRYKNSMRWYKNSMCHMVKAITVTDRNIPAVIVILFLLFVVTHAAITVSFTFIIFHYDVINHPMSQRENNPIIILTYGSFSLQT